MYVAVCCHFDHLLVQLKLPPYILDVLSQLDSSLKKLHSSDPGPPTCLSDSLQSSGPARRLLQLVGFHFQPHGAYITEPYIIYPDWSADDLLRPAFEALRALIGGWCHHVL